MFRANVKMKIEEELANAEAARRAGLEGRARVCARRAAGAAIREFMELRGETLPGPSAVDLLEHLQTRPDVSPELHQAAGHLLARVDESFNLPDAVDLLTEARRLADALEAQTKA